ncbi:MAG: hypothetical protein ACYC2Y_09395 [Armatimonadota bacterium]
MEKRAWEKGKWKPAAAAPSGRKGGYLSEKNLNLNRPQSIEELTGGRMKKKG